MARDIAIDGLEKVLNYSPAGEYVVTTYLLVDGSRTNKRDYLTKLNSMVTKKRSEIESDDNIDENDKKKIYLVLEKIKKYVNDRFKSDATKTLLIYADNNSLWEVLRVPVIMRSKIIIDPKPHTQNLRALLQNFKKYGVLLIDREKAQIYSLYLGEIRQYLAAFINDVPSKVNFRSEAALREKKLLGKIEEKLHHFFKNVNDKALQLFRDGKLDNLILAGRKEILSKFRNYLHNYLESKYIGSIDAQPDTEIHEIKKRTQQLIYDHEKKTKEKLIDKLFEEYNPNGWAVIGIKSVISSLLIEQVRTLVYDRDFSQDGYICDSCMYITLDKKEKCPYCEGKLVYYSDIVDEIVEDALSQNCEIVDVEENEKLKESGGIAAILRYKL
ncbi:MAG: hypothetical protein R6U35_08010 [Candidatus Humimicrobiaceae bacterium]